MKRIKEERKEERMKGKKKERDEGRNNEGRKKG